MDFYTLTYRKILKNELERRIKCNELYSLRAFARDLNLPPGRLCEILQGKQGLSKKVAYDIASVLKFSDVERDYFCTQVEATHARSPVAREAATLRLAQFVEQSDLIPEDYFKIINDWHHLAIMDFTEVEGFRYDNVWIGNKLHLDSQIVAEAIERLINVGLLVVNGEKLSKNADLRVPRADNRNQSMNRFYECVIKKALNQLSIDDSVAGEYSAMNLLLSADQSQYVKKIFRKFERELRMLSANSPVKNRMYMYSSQFIRLDRESSYSCES